MGTEGYRETRLLETGRWRCGTVPLLPSSLLTSLRVDYGETKGRGNESLGSYLRDSRVCLDPVPGLTVHSLGCSDSDRGTPRHVTSPILEQKTSVVDRIGKGNRRETPVGEVLGNRWAPLPSMSVVFYRLYGPIKPTSRIGPDTHLSL